MNKMIIFSIDEKLKRRAQIKALKEGRTLTSVLIEVLTKWIKKT